jgi:ATP-dependent Clp protease ATP-binding subunit ClpB
LQVLDDGRLTDNKGRVVNFKNTIIIMTSNLGSHLIQEKMSDINEVNREEVLSTTRNELFELLKQTLRPEFLNRIDDIIMFTPLTREDVSEIAKLQLQLLGKQLKKNGIDFTFTDECVDWISQLGYDPQFGARPLKRVIQREVLNELSKQILAGKVNKEGTIVLDCFDQQVVFRNQTKEEETV